MSKTLEAVFDGEVLRPEDKSDLEPQARYRITVERLDQRRDPDSADSEEYPLNSLRKLATDMGVDDLAARHDEYAHAKLDDHDNAAG